MIQDRVAPHLDDAVAIVAQLSHDLVVVKLHKIARVRVWEPKPNVLSDSSSYAPAREVSIVRDHRHVSIVSPHGDVVIVDNANLASQHAFVT